MKSEIERRANLSYAEFAESYMCANKPVIVTDAIHNRNHSFSHRRSNKTS